MSHLHADSWKEREETDATRPYLAGRPSLCTARFYDSGLKILTDPCRCSSCLSQDLIQKGLMQLPRQSILLEMWIWSKSTQPRPCSQPLPFPETPQTQTERKIYAR